MLSIPRSAVVLSLSCLTLLLAACQAEPPAAARRALVTATVPGPVGDEVDEMGCPKDHDYASFHCCCPRCPMTGEPAEYYDPTDGLCHYGGHCDPSYLPGVPIQGATACVRMEKEPVKAPVKAP